MSILIVPEWQQFDWLVHGFGTRNSEGWTKRPGRTWLNQIHSTIVIEATLSGVLGEGDALVTGTPGLLLEVRTADCFPVLLVDPARRAVGAVHAGWRGVAARIVPAAVESLANLYGSRPENLQAAIGPGIGPCCFEVGPEVAAQFGESGRVKLDLNCLIRNQLQQAGVRSGKIFAMGNCTRCDINHFHSFRRDAERAGRMASAIGLC